MPFSVAPLSPDLPFGRIIRGLTPTAIKDEAVRADLRRHWAEAGFLMFCDSALTEDFHIDLSRVFGPLEVHKTREFVDTRRPELITIAMEEDRTELEVDGELGDYQSWHKDSVYLEQMQHGGLLRALQVSERGGVTGFIDGVDGYNRLPEDLRKRVETLRVVYQINLPDRQPYSTRSTVRVLRQSERVKSLFGRRDRDFPPVSHPLVFVHPENGKKVLNFSPGHALYIEGMGPDESHALLTTIADFVFDSPAYHHTWSTNEMLLWDNWRMVHMVSVIPYDQVRIMQRTTIAGDYGFGRRVPSAA
jgi:taurine dioxygenase